MRDSARMADQSDPARNRWFSNRWTGPAAPKRNGPETDLRTVIGKSRISSESVFTTAERAGQRAIRGAMQRRADILRRAEIARVLGLFEAANRLAIVAARIRAELVE